MNWTDDADYEAFYTSELMKTMKPFFEFQETLEEGSVEYIQELTNDPTSYTTRIRIYAKLNDNATAMLFKLKFTELLNELR